MLSIISEAFCKSVTQFNIPSLSHSELMSTCQPDRFAFPLAASAADFQGSGPCWISY